MVHKHNEWAYNDIEKNCECGEEHIAFYKAGDIEETDFFMTYILQGGATIAPVDFTFKSTPLYIEKFKLNKLTRRMKTSSGRQYTPTYFTVEKESFITEEEAHFLALCIALQEGYASPATSLLRKWFNANPGSSKGNFVNNLVVTLNLLALTSYSKEKLIEGMVKHYKNSAQDFFLEYMNEEDIVMNNLSPIED